MYIYLIIIGIIAVIAGGFQYIYKTKSWLLFVLRTLVYFLLMLLFINPKIKQTKRKVILPQLFVLADQSQSIKFQNTDNQLINIIKKIKNSSISDKFEVNYLGFSKNTFSLDSIQFSGKRTDIAGGLSAIKDIHNTKFSSPVILLSDGNANKGNDYAYTLNKRDKLQIFPVILGDTTHYENLSIDEINVNPVAFKSNRFPVEIFVSYQGNKSHSPTLFIYDGKKKVFQKNIEFKDKKNIILQLKLQSNNVGNHRYKAYLSNLPDEKNKRDNIKYFSVEIIDQSNKIALISDIIHPDIGVIKRSLSNNKYLQIDLLRPEDNINLKKYVATILYQPNSKFQNIFKNNKLSQQNWFIISGLSTDWSWLNKQEIFFKKDFTQSNENYFPTENTNFSLFDLPEINYRKLPPLVDKYGKISYSQGEVALFSSVKGIVTNQPLLMFNKQPKQGVLFGENIWQWNMQAGIQNKKDEFNKLIISSLQYILLQKNYNKISLDYKKEYQSDEEIIIRATILNENLQRDDNHTVKIKLFKDRKLLSNIPMIADYNAYKISFKDLVPGNYYFEIIDESTNSKRKAYFTIENTNIEKLQNTANYNQLSAIAKNTNGKVYFPNQIDKLIKNLNQQGKYPAHSKILTQKSPLIDYKWLLFLIILLLSIEWFIKKLQGRL